MSCIAVLSGGEQPLQLSLLCLLQDKNSSYECFHAHDDIVTVAIFAPGTAQQPIAPHSLDQPGSTSKGLVILTAGYSGGWPDCLLPQLAPDKAKWLPQSLFRQLMQAVLALQGKSGYLRMLLLLPLCENPRPPKFSPLSAGLSICVGFTNGCRPQMPAD